MKKDIILAGVGGQGIVSIAAVIGLAAVDLKLSTKQSEVHGMSQRGGDVSSNLRVSDTEIFSDLIPKGKADLIISVEPMEALRHLHMLAPDGWLISNTEPFKNIPNYPDKDALLAEIGKLKQHVLIDADKMAKDQGASKAANMIILGASSPFLEIEFSKLEDAIRKLFGKKGDDVVNSNINALRSGRDFVKDLIK
ncbi:MAG: indolepyruvate oxidoreductase subunit beta [Bacteroidota bacterium]